MKDNFGLNIKQKLFADLYDDVSNKDLYGNATKCYMQVYNIKDEKVAEAAGSRLLLNVKINDYRNSSKKSIYEIMAENSTNLLNKAIELANQGNTSVLNKLLDKIMPTVLEQHNTNSNLTPDEMLRQITEKALNKSDNKSHIPKSDKAPKDYIPVTASNNNDLQK